MHVSSSPCVPHAMPILSPFTWNVYIKLVNLKAWAVIYLPWEPRDTSNSLLLPGCHSWRNIVGGLIFFSNCCFTEVPYHILQFCQMKMVSILQARSDVYLLTFFYQLSVTTKLCNSVFFAFLSLGYVPSVARVLFLARSIGCDERVQWMHFASRPMLVCLLQSE